MSLAASSIYLVNDARDVEADRAHPTKRFRPIAAGVVPEWLAYTLAAVLAVAALGISWLATPNLTLVVAIYLVIQLAYCFGLKHQAVLDICIVSSGFLIRAIAAASLRISLCLNGSSWSWHSARYSWPPASAMQKSSWPNALVPRSESRWRATPPRTCALSG